MDESPKMDFFNNLLIVLVIYRMKIAKSPSYRSLTDALSLQKKSISLFIYDNSPQSQELSAAQCWNIIYQHDPSNAGVSKAYNEGFKKAKEQNKKWLLLLDQDTSFPKDIFEKYSGSLTTYPNNEIFSLVIKSANSILSPFHFRWGRGISIPFARSGLYSLRDYKFINSGLLVSTNLFSKCGGYDDRFPLDFSDLVFAERVAKFADGFVLIEASCSHSLSSEENSFEMSMNRFSHFAVASKAYGRLRSKSFVLFISRCLRCIKLCFRFRSLAFIKIIIRE